jgi:hypothetical protein
MSKRSKEMIAKEPVAELDEIQVHIVPVLLGDGGIRLFDHMGTRQIELEQTRVVESSAVTHLRFRVVR